MKKNVFKYLILAVAYFVLYESFCIRSMGKQESVLLDVFGDVDVPSNQKLLNQLRYIAENSKFPNNKYEARYALMYIYNNGVKGEKKDFNKARYWCNMLNDTASKPSYSYYDCVSFKSLESS